MNDIAELNMAGKFAGGVRLVACGLFAILSPPDSVAQSSPEQSDTGMSVAEFEATVMSLPLFPEIVRNWENKSEPGNIARDYKPIEVIETFPAGEQIIFPEPGDVIVYQLTGLSYNNPYQRPEDERITASSVRITAINAKTREIIAWNELPVNNNIGFF